MIHFWNDQVESACGTHDRNMHMRFSGENWRKYPVEIPRWRWDDNIEMDSKQDGTV